MRNDLLFETDRFNLSEVKSNFINPCCFGEDLAVWLRARLLERGYEVIEPGQEDWGWYIEAEIAGVRYFIGIGGNADESSEKSDQGEWRIMVESPRSFWEKLKRKNKESHTADMVSVIQDLIKAETDFRNLRLE
jgi:hypothetical protein